MYFKRNPFSNLNVVQSKYTTNIQQCKLCYNMFLLQITIIRQTFQFMDRNM